MHEPPTPGDACGRYTLPDTHIRLRERVRTLAATRIAPFAASVDAGGRFPHEALDALVSADLHAVHVPRTFGGPGADSLSVILVVEEIARVCAASALLPGVNRVGSLPLLLAGSERLKRRYLPQIASGEAMISFCLSETNAGSDALAMETTAVRAGDSYVLDGVKRWVINGGVSEYYVVMAVTAPRERGRGISAFLVDRSDPGVSFRELAPKMGVRGTPTPELRLDGVRVPADRMIGAEGTGFATAMATMDHNRVTAAAQALGIAQGALDHVKDTLRERRRSGGPGAGQVVRIWLADLAMRIEAARQLTYAAAARSARAAADLTFFGAAAKCLASDTAMKVTTDAVQLLGDEGYSGTHPLERMMRDAKVIQIYDGTNQIQRIVMARHVLGRR
ncbi:acyl-CoA dehydrogenase family protein [Streptomyces sp. NPDC127068]|uniref:acyl-CoA dehydrogenase family protein n=1 Tax=Streptomyces sp. NPDC127068 TaxID=3347127 RepID=UPI0036511D23